MARKNPVGKLAETALSTLKDPKGTAGKVVGQARTTVAFGRALGNTAGAVAGHAAGKVSERVSGRRPQERPGTESAGRSQEQPTARGGLRAVPEVNEPAATQPPRTSRGTSDSPKAHGDALAPTKKATGARKSTAKKAPAKKAAGATQAPAKKAPAKKPAPSKKTAASPADVAEVVESKVAEDPKKTAARPAKKAPAKKAPAKKAPAKKAPAKKSSPSGKLPAKKSQRAEPAAEQQAGADEARPKSAAEVAAVEGEDVQTPAGTSAAGRGSNPDTGDTGLTQPGTEEVVDPATAKQVSSETQKLRKAAEKNPE